MPAPRRRSCPATARSPICSGRMTQPAPLRPSPVPSISRLFAAAFLAIAVAGLAERVAIWRSARRTQADRSEEHTSELQSHSDLVCRLLLEKKKKKNVQLIESV